MTVETVTGNDSLILDGKVLNDLANGDCVSIEYPNDSVSVQKGKNGNTIFSFNSQGEIINVTIRCLVNGETDKYLNNKYIQYKQSPTSFVLLNGTFTKRTGDGAGNETKKVYNVTAGVISRPPSAIDSSEGNTDTAVAVYNLVFASGDPAIA